MQCKAPVHRTPAHPQLAVPAFWKDHLSDIGDIKVKDIYMSSKTCSIVTVLAGRFTARDLPSRLACLEQINAPNAQKLHTLLNG